MDFINFDSSAVQACIPFLRNAQLEIRMAINMYTPLLFKKEYVGIGPKVIGKTITYLFAAQIILQACNESPEKQARVSIEEIDDSLRDMRAATGMVLCPECSAGYLGIQKLAEQELLPAPPPAWL